MTPQTLYAAYSRAYELEGKARRWRQGVDAALAAGAVVLAVLDKEVPFLAGIALVWLVARELPLFTQPDEHRRQAVNIQEQFDCAYPGIDWNDALNGQPEQAHKIKALASASSAVLSADYWVGTEGLPDLVGALLRQGQSALWGQEGHERYWKLNVGAVGVFVLALSLLSWALGLSFGGAIVGVFAPAAPLAVGRVQAARRHRNEALERKDMSRTIERELEVTSLERLPSSNFVQSMQGRLYRSRLNGGPIPQWIYERYAEHDRGSIDSWLEGFANDLRQRLRDEPLP